MLSSSDNDNGKRLIGKGFTATGIGFYPSLTEINSVPLGGNAAAVAGARVRQPSKRPASARPAPWPAQCAAGGRQRGGRQARQHLAPQRDRLSIMALLIFIQRQ